MRAPVFIPLFVLALLAALSFGADVVAGVMEVSGMETDLGLRLMPPSARHLLGTDELGRDVFARLLEGGRVSLMIGLATAALAAGLGALLGAAAGYLGGLFDAAVMRVADFMLALPGLPLLIVLSAVDMGKVGFENGVPDAARIIVLLSLFGWMGTARLARARARVLAAADFTRAARALGASHMRIIFRHILPGISRTVAAAAALAAGGAVMAESALSFLGLGVRPPAASWGAMLAGAQENLWDRPALALWPGVMIFVTVLSAAALADGLAGDATSS